MSALFRAISHANHMEILGAGINHKRDLRYQACYYLMGLSTLCSVGARMSNSRSLFAMHLVTELTLLIPRP
jgi:hypothetical protein